MDFLLLLSKASVGNFNRSPCYSFGIDRESRALRLEPQSLDLEYSCPQKGLNGASWR